MCGLPPAARVGHRSAPARRLGESSVHELPRREARTVPVGARPVVESCLNCHLPHGSNRDALLTTSIPFLCQECHAQLGLVNHPTRSRVGRISRAGSAPTSASRTAAVSTATRRSTARTIRRGRVSTGDRSPIRSTRTLDRRRDAAGGDRARCSRPGPRDRGSGQRGDLRDLAPRGSRRPLLAPQDPAPLADRLPLPLSLRSAGRSRALARLEDARLRLDRLGGVVRRTTDEAYYREYTDRSDGILDALRLDARHTSGAYAELGAQALGRNDASLFAEGGWRGSLRVRGYYDELLHRFADDARVLYQGVGSEHLTLPAGLPPRQQHRGADRRRAGVGRREPRRAHAQEGRCRRAIGSASEPRAPSGLPARAAPRRAALRRRDRLRVPGSQRRQCRRDTRADRRPHPRLPRRTVVRALLAPARARLRGLALRHAAGIAHLGQSVRGHRRRPGPLCARAGQPCAPLQRNARLHASGPRALDHDARLGDGATGRDPARADDQRGLHRLDRSGDFALAAHRERPSRHEPGHVDAAVLAAAQPQPRWDGALPQAQQSDQLQGAQPRDRRLRVRRRGRELRRPAPLRGRPLR